MTHSLNDTLVTARELAAAGRHSDVVEYITPHAEHLNRSADLALMLGSAEARCGRTDAGFRWIDQALSTARSGGDRQIERRALSARGSLALVTGRVDEAADYYTQGLLAASRDDDLPGIGRCSNNIGIVNDLRGRHAEAISSYTLALRAWERAEEARGAAECHHNLGIAYREQADFESALRSANRAVRAAEATGDQALVGVALRGRAEIRIAQRGNLAEALREITRARTLHESIRDLVEVAEDLRVVAALHIAKGQLDDAEPVLRDVASRAQTHHRALLVAEATRDLAYLLNLQGQRDAAHAAARAAQAIFTRMGAEHELRKMAQQEWEEDFSEELGNALAPLHTAQELADAGRYHELIDYLAGRSTEEMDRSPTLALLRGIGHARLGQFDEAQQWSILALTRARATGDRAVEVRSLNVCGVVALERGGLAEAQHFFTKAQEESLRDGDLATVGRSANNMGIVANMRGDFDRAVGAYSTAIAAYQRAHYTRGVAETEHNLGITRREQGNHQDALEAADAAVRDAETVGDPALKAQALAGRAEIRIVAGEPRIGLHEVQRALAIHREVGDAVREAEDLRILGAAHAALGDLAAAEECLRTSMTRAHEHDRPLLAACAQRDLAQVLVDRGDTQAGRKAGAQARQTFARLNAANEVTRLDEFLAGW